ncbi:glycosyltransferase family 4 protein [Neobacillus sp. PS3-34]|uniref:glycosyltransferase family 4 protein n=1 Tax=Neobacillus sp. PS3-34 TaxID=3070678 RepID=UPI0027DED09D|nr:glycosyltransferase family 4 protein [Neobacillus sp. PS3-34]WML46678.1 glycosyltransferase family 4 protein [Neobacillus sp. PS3-34]
MRILIVSHHSGSLINFRGDLLRKIISLGHEVIAIAPDSKVKPELDKMNIKLEIAEIDKQGLGILQNVRYLMRIISVIKKYKIDLVFGYTVKPIVFGSLASLLTRTKNFYAMVEGLGGVFTEPFTNKKLLLQFIIKRLYALSFKVSKKVFLLNQDDLKDLTKMNLLEERKAVVIPGIGVDLEKYKRATLPKKPIFLIIARLVYSKGVIDYCEAAKIIKKTYPDVQFNILGGFDNKEDTIPKKIFQAYVDQKTVCYLGEASDVRPHIENSSVFVLPSYYREGLPRSIVESMAMGRPIITTDNVGCRDTVINGENGYLVPTHNPNLLAEKMELLIKDSELRENMGSKSWEICKQKYDGNMINNILVNEMELLKNQENCKK